MALSFVPLTELDAVNIMLEVIGEMPVNQLPAEGVADALIAQQLLHNRSRAVQSLKLNCNSEADVELSPDGDGHIIIPTNAIFIDPVLTADNYVWRAGNLYDKTNHTDVFTDSVKVNITYFLPFADLPQSVRDFITISAARQFAARVLGSDSNVKYTQLDEQQAWHTMYADEVEVSRASLYDSPSFARLQRGRRP